MGIAAVEGAIVTSVVTAPTESYRGHTLFVGLLIAISTLIGWRVSRQ
jgi:hypothetical protein